jgi:hypothetical protein
MRGEVCSTDRGNRSDCDDIPTPASRAVEGWNRSRQAHARRYCLPTHGNNLFTYKDAPSLQTAGCNTTRPPTPHTPPHHQTPYCTHLLVAVVIDKQAHHRAIGGQAGAAGCQGGLQHRGVAGCVCQVVDGAHLFLHCYAQSFLLATNCTHHASAACCAGRVVMGSWLLVC